MTYKIWLIYDWYLLDSSSIQSQRDFKMIIILCFRARAFSFSCFFHLSSSPIFDSHCFSSCILWKTECSPKITRTKNNRFPYPWIMGKKSKTRNRHRARFAEKNPERSIESICICSCALEFFSGNHARSRSQKMAYNIWYIFVQHNIFPHILAYAISNKHHKKAQLTLYLHI